MRDRRRRVTIDLAIAATIAVTGAVVNQRYARMGVMPLDHSIVFDGGWRLLSGQVPWRDFVTPFGVVPSAMQAAAFGVFGVTWSAFAWHASIVNGLFAAVVYALLVTLRLPRPLSTGYAAAAMVFFYPPVGAPFADQHSFFFALVMIFAGVAGNTRRTEWGQMVCWGLVPVFGALAFLSKPVPFAFAVAAVPLLMAVPAPAGRGTRLAGLVLGLAVTGVLAVLLVAALGIDTGLLGDYAWTRPRQISADRVATLGSPFVQLASRYRQFPVLLGLTFAVPALAWWAACAAAAGPLAWWSRGDRTGDHWREAGVLTTAVALAAVTYATSLLFSFVSNNQKENALAFLPVAAGLVHAGMAAAIRATAPPAAARWILVAVSVLPAWHWYHDARHFTVQVNETRMVADLTFDPVAADAAAGDLPPGLAGLRWATPARFDGDGWRALMHFLAGRDEPVLVLGDMLLTYGLLGQPSIGPSLWFHPGLTMPAPGTPEAAAYESDLIRRAEAGGVQLVVVDDSAWFGPLASVLPAVQAWLTASWCEHRTFGAQHVYERCR